MQNSCSILRTILVCIVLVGCSTKGGNQEAPSHSVEFEVAEDKAAMTAYWQLDHIKEWYTERVLPTKFDYSIDLSQKTVTELWLLRNEIFARNGYLFEDAVLRGYFNQFKWYQPIFDVPDFKVTLDSDEQKFVDKVLAREHELGWSRTVSQGGYDMVPYEHIFNTIQFKDIPAALRDALVARNFAIVPSQDEQLYHVYENNHYQYVPNFITTDLYLQILHKHFSSTLQNIEEEHFIPLLEGLLNNVYNTARALANTSRNEQLKASADWSATYVAVAVSLLDSTRSSVPEQFADQYENEMSKTTDASGTGSTFLDSRLINYTDFTPRGNYTKTPGLMRYFRCVKWLNSAPIYIDSDERFLSAVVIAASIKNDPGSLASFKRFNEAIKFIVGDEDNLSLANLIEAITNAEASNLDQLASPEKLKELRARVSSKGVNKIRGKGTGADAQALIDRPSILFTAGRYTFDAEIMSRLVHVLQPAKRPFPKALDVFAAFGNTTAETILTKEINEKRTWVAYPDTLAKLKRQFKDYSDWDRNIYTKTFETLQAVNDVQETYPLFTKTPAWGKRNLLTALAGWTELKHDMLLYAERPYAAEAGEGGGPPPPKHISYVEPNVKFWTKALELLDLQEQTLAKMQLTNSDVSDVNASLKTMGTFLLAVSKAELSGEKISDEAFQKLTWLGGEIEGLTLRIIKSDHLPENEKNIALVADVYAFKNTLLEEGVGTGDEIYVVAEINGKPYITRGAVFSYYEFQSDSPLTDEAWREMLHNGNAPPRPDWLKEIMVSGAHLESLPSYSF